MCSKSSRSADTRTLPAVLPLFRCSMANFHLPSLLGDTQHGQRGDAENNSAQTIGADPFFEQHDASEGHQEQRASGGERKCNVSRHASRKRQRGKALPGETAAAHYGSEEDFTAVH